MFVCLTYYFPNKADDLSSRQYEATGAPWHKTTRRRHACTDPLTLTDFYPYSVNLQALGARRQDSQKQNRKESPLRGRRLQAVR
jgi:hypothetical protein